VRSGEIARRIRKTTWNYVSSRASGDYLGLRETTWDRGQLNLVLRDNCIEYKYFIKIFLHPPHTDSGTSSGRFSRSQEGNNQAIKFWQIRRNIILTLDNRISWNTEIHHITKSITDLNSEVIVALKHNLDRSQKGDKTGFLNNPGKDFIPWIRK